jgi:putative endonuclease
MMAFESKFCVYIMTNANNTVLYTGVTNNLQRRVNEHKKGKGSTFTKKYNLNKLVYYEIGNDIRTALAREKQIKGGSRQKKIDLIISINPEWKDLYKELFG